MKLKIKMLNAFNGDSFLISINENNETKNIIVDGRIRKTYARELRDEIKRIIKRNENIDLMFITHVDDDHIGGIISFFEDNEIDKSIVKRVLFNSANTISNTLKTQYDPNREIPINKITDKKVSYNQGKTLEQELLNYDLLEKNIIKVGTSINIGSAKIKILSPRDIDIEKLDKKWTREASYKRKVSSVKNDYDKYIEDLIINDTYDKDKSIVNISSISFLLEFGEFKILMLADTRSDIITKSLNDLGYNKENKLSVDYVKLPHHGSCNNLFYDLLEIISCRRYIISTDGSIFNHPDKRTLARILNSFSDVEFYFNNHLYNDIFLEGDKQKYKFKCIEQKLLELDNERDI